MSKVTLGQVAVEVRESTKDPTGLPVVGLEHLVPGELQLTQWSESSENTFTRLFHTGQVLFGRRRAYQKKTAVATFDGVCSGDITVIAAKPERLLPDLLPFIVSDDRFFDYAMEKSAGSLSPRDKWAQLAEYSFDLPDSTEEQQKLASLLWAMERTKTAYKNLLAQTDELVKSRFVEMFGDPETNPLGWPQMRLDNVVTYSNNGITRRSSDEGGSIVLRIVDLQDGFIDYSNVNRIRIDQKEEKCLLKDRDMLFVRVNGNPDYVARSAIFSDIGEPVYHNDHIIRMRIDADKASAGFIRAYTNTNYGKKQLKDHIKTSAGQYSISQDGIGSIQIYLPPLMQQEQYISFVNGVDKSKYRKHVGTSRDGPFIEAMN